MHVNSREGYIMGSMSTKNCLIDTMVEYRFQVILAMFHDFYGSKAISTLLI